MTTTSNETEKGVRFASSTLKQTRLILRSKLENLVNGIPGWVERIKGTANTDQGVTLVQASSHFRNLIAQAEPLTKGLILIYPEDFSSEITITFHEWREWFFIS